MSSVYEGQGTQVIIRDPNGNEIGGNSFKPPSLETKPLEPLDFNKKSEPIVFTNTERKPSVTSPLNEPIGNNPLNRPIGSNPKKNNGKDQLGRGETASPEDFDKLLDDLLLDAVEPFYVDYDAINESSLSQIE